MKTFACRLIVASFAIAAFAPVAATAAPPAVAAQASPLASQAPLDRYFGKLGMSPLGIVNAIKLVNYRTDTAQVDSATALGGLSLVEDAVKDWEAQYPADIWLPRVVMSIERVYRKIDDDRARAAQLRVDAWITTKYPDSDEAHTVLAAFDAREGITEAAYAAKTDPVPSVLKP